MMNSTQFQALSPSEVAAIVKMAGPRTCVFPINGTRRWCMLQYQPDSPDYWDSYMELGSRNHVEMYSLFFEHGIPTLLAESMEGAARFASGSGRHGAF